MVTDIKRQNLGTQIKRREKNKRENREIVMQKKGKKGKNVANKNAEDKL